VGAGGIIYKTTDGGVTWEKENPPPGKISNSATDEPADLNCVFFIDENYGWIVGDNGTIYYTENGGGSYVKIKSDSKPTDFVLAQNYPNPFNPSTTIEFSIPFESDVTLDIYNLLGEKVHSTFISSLNQGKHSVEWNGFDDNGNTLSSGIYIYTLQTDSFYLTKKMILLR